jgi:hypothetical protein
MKRVLLIIPAYKGLFLGHVLLMISGLFYSLAWLLDKGHTGYMDLWYAKVAYYISISVGGFAFLLLLDGARVISLDLKGVKLKCWHITLFCLVAYTVALVLTSGWYQRKYTAELFLLMAWANLQLCVLYAMYYHGWMNKVFVFISVFFVFLGTTVGIILYNYYYSYTGDVQFNLGFYPYIALVFVVGIITMLLVLGKRTGRRDGYEEHINKWDPDFKKKGRCTITIWTILCFLGTLSGWAYMVLHPWRGDMFANQLLLGAGFIFLFVYLPYGIHTSMLGYERYRMSKKFKGIPKGRDREVADSLADSLEKKGYEVKRYSDQQVLPELDTVRMHALEVSDPSLLVLVKVLNGWPNLARKDLVVLWGKRTDENKELSSLVFDLVKKELK